MIDASPVLGFSCISSPPSFEASGHVATSCAPPVASSEVLVPPKGRFSTFASVKKGETIGPVASSGILFCEITGGASTTTLASTATGTKGLNEVCGIATSGALVGAESERSSGVAASLNTASGENCSSAAAVSGLTLAIGVAVACGCRGGTDKAGLLSPDETEAVFISDEGCMTSIKRPLRLTEACPRASSIVSLPMRRAAALIFSYEGSSPGASVELSSVLLIAVGSSASLPIF